VIVTGGTGALGAAVVRAFLAANDRVVVPWIVAAEQASIAQAERDALRAGRLVLLEADVAEPAGAEAIAKAAGTPGVLVNGVGGFAGGAPLHETDPEIWQRMFRMNVLSAATMSRAVLPSMLARRSGVLLFVASRAAIDPPAGIAAYAASKAALIALVGSLQREVVEAGLRANAVVPTTIDTPANRAAMPDADFSRWTPPARIAEVLVWLASEAAATVRGGLIPV
jgi:NAD(P)-dependent dehydrogenase (short-subunit alcohol dehydrogenase family)